LFEGPWLFARTTLTCVVAVLSSWSMLALESVSTDAIAVSSTL